MRAYFYHDIFRNKTLNTIWFKIINIAKGTYFLFKNKGISRVEAGIVINLNTV